RAAAALANQRRLEHRHVILRVAGAIHELMLLRREHPEQRALGESKAPSADHIGDCPAHDQVQLKLDVMMALENRRIADRLRQKQEAIVTRPKLQLFEHKDKI